MVGYPTFTQNGMIVKAMCSPSVIFGSLVKVKSTLRLPLTPNGQWQVAGVTYELQTLTPRGDWFMTLDLVPPGYVVIPPLWLAALPLRQFSRMNLQYQAQRRVKPGALGSS